MWKHMARVIGEVRPRYAFVENSPMLVGRGLSTVLADLAEMGYDAKWGIVGAHHVSAPHRRDRIWILATDSTQLQRDGINNNTGKLLEPKSIPELGNNSGADDISNSNLSQRKGMRCTSRSNQEYSDIVPRCSWWRQDPAEALESPVGRVANGVANRVDRLKAIGNGQVSICAAKAWEILSEMA
jgi:DNA (cytosine-5)-methyltransferase 1